MVAVPVLQGFLERHLPLDVDNFPASRVKRKPGVYSFAGNPGADAMHPPTNGQNTGGINFCDGCTGQPREICLLLLMAKETVKTADNVCDILLAFRTVNGDHYGIM